MSGSWRCGIGIALCYVWLTHAWPTAQAESPTILPGGDGQHPGKSIQPIPFAFPIRVTHNVRAGQAASVTVPVTQFTPPGAAITPGADEALVYQNDHGFRGFLPMDGSVGTFTAQALELGNWFEPGDAITRYELLFYGDPVPGGPFDVHVELWDGDPWGIEDTPDQGYSGAPIPGTEADFLELSSGVHRLVATLPAKVSLPHAKVWMVVTSTSCRGG